MLLKSSVQCRGSCSVYCNGLICDKGNISVYSTHNDASSCQDRADVPADCNGGCQVVSIYQKWSKEGTVVNRRQGHGRPRLIDAPGKEGVGGEFCEESDGVLSGVGEEFCQESVVSSVRNQMEFCQESGRSSVRSRDEFCEESDGVLSGVGDEFCEESDGVLSEVGESGVSSVRNQMEFCQESGTPPHFRRRRMAPARPSSSSSSPGLAPPHSSSAEEIAGHTSLPPSPLGFLAQPG
ncbi:hypothetical protein QTP70_000443 [Hemibagrus guttatus]|uniref:Uncharacterized protein n=1 Tax=Hemibagrus guttatus TaxID=175788 RepID=A0AAE0QM01_9TELE|nr:hypothetical protein QTP70_000443 [Hemibagrus guttatus]